MVSKVAAVDTALVEAATAARAVAVPHTTTWVATKPRPLISVGSKPRRPLVSRILFKPINISLQIHIIHFNNKSPFSKLYVWH